MATKEKTLLGPSCLTAAAPDEPIFVLRANDELAVDIVKAWADRYMLTKIEQQGKLTEKQLQKYRGAHQIAREMEKWRKQ